MQIMQSVILYIFYILKVDSASIFDGFRKVVAMDEIFDVIKSVHEKSAAHSGVQKTYEIVSDAHARIIYYYTYRHACMCD